MQQLAADMLSAEARDADQTGVCAAKKWLVKLEDARASGLSNELTSDPIQRRLIGMHGQAPWCTTITLHCLFVPLALDYLWYDRYNA